MKNKKSRKAKKDSVKIPIDINGQKEKDCNCDAFFHQKPRTELEKFVSDKIPMIADTLGLGKLNYFFNTIRHEIDLQKLGINTEEDGDLVMAINYRDAYKTAYINICPSAVKIWESGDKGMILHAIVHEMAHIVTSELSDLARARCVTPKEVRDAVENTTEAVAMIGRELLSKKHPNVFVF